MKRHPFILASGSPRRRELLSWAGLDFEVSPGEVDETQKPGEEPLAYVRRLALAKAEEAARRLPGVLVLAADTIVTIDGVILGKPGDRKEAEEMLRMLSGREHMVITAFCLKHGDNGLEILDHAVTLVQFRKLCSADINRYIDSGEIWDKAGAYAIQGKGGALITRINGSHTNVIGLPVAEVLDRLKEQGIKC